jgi:hypothetical protein
MLVSEDLQSALDASAPFRANIVPIYVTTSVHFVYGSVFCFFGGTFPTLFAAVQAAEHGGRATVMQALSDLSDEALIVINESKKDDDAKTDAGTKDMSPTQFIVHKTKLVLKKMNPEKVDKAMGSLYGVWLTVAAVLAIQFARTVSMALSIADFLKKPVDRFITPTLNLAIPKDYEKWVPVVMGWIVKAIAMSIAWKIQVRHFIDPPLGLGSAKSLTFCFFLRRLSRRLPRHWLVV